MSLGKESSLQSSDVMLIKGGVKLTIFAPDKWNKGIPDSDSENPHASEPK